MEITKVTVRKIEKENSRMKGIASLTFDNVFAVHDIRIIDGDNGPFIAFPSRKTTTGVYRDTAHPVNQEFREVCFKAIMEEFDKTETESNYED